MKNRQSKEDPEANCLPAGIPRGSPYPWRIVQTPTHYFILFEGNIHSYRQIFMNAKHPDDPDPTWYGHSVGHWEGNTLVVDTVGFNDKFWFDYKGHPHTEKLHTIERYTRTDLGHMAIEVTIDDPGAYAKPFTTVGRATLMPGTELLEYICQENNQDLPLLTRPARVREGSKPRRRSLEITAVTSKTYTRRRYVPNGKRQWQLSALALIVILWMLVQQERASAAVKTPVLTALDYAEHRHCESIWPGHRHLSNERQYHVRTDNGGVFIDKITPDGFEKAE